MPDFQKQARGDYGQKPVQTYPTQRQSGVVKIFKTVEGYGFFKVQGQSDVYFNMKDFQASHITVPPKVGEKYRFEILKKHFDDNTVKFRASKICKVPTHHTQSKDGLSNEWTKYRNINDSLQPHFKREVPKGHGGAVASNGAWNKNDTSKCSASMKSVYKIGNPVKVPMGKPVVVSATGPNSAEMAPTPMDESTRKLHEEISRKKCLFKSLNLAKLPDGGRRLIEEIASLESQLKNVYITNKEKAKVIESSSSETQPQTTQQETLKVDPATVNSRVHSSHIPYQSMGKNNQDSDVSCSIMKKTVVQSHPVPEKQFGAKFIDFAHMPDGPLFGGRMTNDRLSEVRLVG